MFWNFPQYDSFEFIWEIYYCQLMRWQEGIVFTCFISSWEGFQCDHCKPIMHWTSKCDHCKPIMHWTSLYSPLLVTSSGHQWRLFQTCSFENPPSQVTSDCARMQYISYWNTFLSHTLHIHMSHFSYGCKTEGENGISRLISETA